MTINQRDLARMQGMTGEGALLAAVISTALIDALGKPNEHRADAWQYFASDTYTKHLELLDLSPDLLPKPMLELIQ